MLELLDLQFAVVPDARVDRRGRSVTTQRTDRPMRSGGPANYNWPRQGMISGNWPLGFSEP